MAQLGGFVFQIFVQQSHAIDENQSLDYEINSAAEVDSLFQVTEIEDLKFVKETSNSATYKVKVGVIRGGHITSSCTVIATYEDSVIVTGKQIGRAHV